MSFKSRQSTRGIAYHALNIAKNLQEQVEYKACFGSNGGYDPVTYPIPVQGHTEYIPNDSGSTTTGGIPLGAGQGGRIGDDIKPTSLDVKILLNANTSTVTHSHWPQMVRVMAIRCNGDFDPTSAPANPILGNDYFSPTSKSNVQAWKSHSNNFDFKILYDHVFRMVGSGSDMQSKYITFTLKDDLRPISFDNSTSVVTANRLCVILFSDNTIHNGGPVSNPGYYITWKLNYSDI